jgi:hypothetical protein
VAAAALLLLLVPTVPTPGPRNAAADAVVEGSRLLGIDFRQGKAGARAPSAEAAQALRGATVGAWLDSQIDDESAEIGEPAAALREYLEQNRDTLSTIVSSLEKEKPDWGSDFLGEDGTLQVPFLPVLRLERVLVAAALVEEKEGRTIEAGRVLDAAWVLARSVSLPTNLLTLSISIAAERMQVGALRKMRAPPLQWLDRLSSDGPWTRMPDALRVDQKLRPRSSDELGRVSSEVAAKAFSAVADALAKLSPCDPTLGSDREIWKPATDALAAETNATKRAIRDVYDANMGETIAVAVRRSARLEVDREMTLRVLQLRLEKEASRDGGWPAKLSDATSAACPEASYAYESTSEGVALHFVGSVEAPKGFLPLAFRASQGAPQVTEPKECPPALTPNPAGGMIAPP